MQGVASVGRPSSTFVGRRTARAVGVALLVLLCSFGFQSSGAMPSAQAIGTYQLLGQGLDSCQAPSITTMTNMWSNSPYYYWGIYIGGDDRGCLQPNLTSSWVATVTNSSSMSWRLLPIWVGPQDPCEPGFSTYISLTSSTAETQGKNEAIRAYSALTNLGLPTSSPVDYDLEAGSTTISSSCLNAIRWFLEGWDNQLQTAPAQKSGVYTSACAGKIDTFSSIGNPPDFIDAADYSGKSTASIPCIPDNHWYQQQRHRQWVGDHLYTHNGSSVHVDTRCANAWVVGISTVQDTSSGC